MGHEQKSAKTFDSYLVVGLVSDSIALLLLVFVVFLPFFCFWCLHL